MRIAIVGGTGTLGRYITAQLAERGHEVRVLSRSSAQYPVDLVSGQGLAAALAGCAVVVDASNASAPRRAAQVLVEGSRQLLTAGQRAGVTHHVAISIVGCDLVPMGYYRVKTEQEQVVNRGPLPWSIVAATQFHELAATALAAAAKWRVLPTPAMRIQTIAAADVARAVADVAEGEPRQQRIKVAGPQIMTAAELAGTWRSITGRRALSVPVPVPGKLGQALRAGALTTQHADVLGEQTFADWLSARVAADRARPSQSA
jgi:uncharacterized protein YbjT (DUF2867 family)